jgi:hypothetical protein
MSQNDTLHFAQEFLGRMGSGAEPGEIAKRFPDSHKRSRFRLTVRYPQPQ